MYKSLYFNAGVYMVDIYKEQHKVTVTGTVDSDALIEKLGRSGKHAEIWSQVHNQHQTLSKTITYKTLVGSRMETRPIT